jgi:hypothetical protein
MRRLTIQAILALAAVMLAACGEAPKPAEPAAPQKAAAPAVPPEIEAVVKSVLGSEAEVIVWGDLALTGSQQVLAINRLKATPKGAVPGILLVRAALVGKEGMKWHEMFRCDEHLKNPKGYLGGTPIAGVHGWRLQYEQDPEKGLTMYFTPLEKPAGGYIQTFGVRWDPKARQYRTMDRNYEKFLPEVKMLGTVRMPLMR